jgi:hypothetical protein
MTIDRLEQRVNFYRTTNLLFLHLRRLAALRRQGDVGEG